MSPPYSSYAALAAEQTEGVDYTRTAITPTGVSWAAIAIHGGGIEAGTGELAREIAGTRMAFYEFAGIKPTGNNDLHITSSLFDEPQALALVGASSRTVSCHGMAGTDGVAETYIGGLDGQLRDLILAKLTAAGFTVTVASTELAGSDPTNICNKNSRKAGVQLEMSNTLRASFFPGGDLSAANRATGERTATFYAYAAAVQAAVIEALTYDDTISRVRLAGTVPGVKDVFARTVTGGWGESTSGHTWTTSGGSTADFTVSGGFGRHAQPSANVSRWSLIGPPCTDTDFVISLSSNQLSTGGSQFLHVAARAADTSNCYLARVELNTSNAVLLTLRKRVAGVETLLSSTVNTGLTHTAGATYTVRFQVTGSTLAVKLWTTAEPDAWTITLTDNSVTAAGQIGVRSLLSSANTNTSPTASYAALTSVGAATVERSTDAITWTTVRGGLALPGNAGLPVNVDDYEFAAGVVNHYRVRVYAPTGATLFTESDTITPVLDSAWIKNPQRPSLNRKVTVAGISDITRPTRSSVVEVVGRTLPVVISDVQGSRRLTLTVMTRTLAEAADLDQVFASGLPVFLQAPELDAVVPTMYASVGEVTLRRGQSVRAPRRFFDLPLTECAPPASTVYGGTYTWDDVLADYATWNDVLANVATWDDLVNQVSDNEVVVP
ncbi:poly-gamma-glutamate hydrolase family protein [Amycolatopsis sp. FDAARGOS 1241]|uniref:poly-gamma-glutamate hydrolase family protein n=1 Tax=Amycolatopsis sp. FDAARGOS 1241 TaxID=2778070 RepID=UPI00195224B2|nr:poly-gamma-glutamate hydrolase family protein [Amycolatopsis sp. FDAARGOS 1241]QRP48010.1 poly-gamma-glutamate hydrolase family protein [Amycolatopsis sp. FDAARGOS 1241]